MKRDKPHVIILANSAYASYNERIIAAGAVDTIQKKIPRFFEWWISYYHSFTQNLVFCSINCLSCYKKIYHFEKNR